MSQIFTKSAADTSGVIASSNLTDNSVIRGDGGAKGVQDSGIFIDDSDNMTGVAALQADSISFDTGSNVLDSFVDTTAWTPALDFGGGTTGITYGSQSGTYVRIGPMVFFQLFINLTSKGSSTGTARITGLPITPNNIFQGSIQCTELTFSGDLLTPQIFDDSGFAITFKNITSGSGATNLTNTGFIDTTDFRITGLFHTS